MARASQTVPDWAIGCMDREYIILDGADKDPSLAIWIQTESQYIDLRIPHDRPDFAGRRSLDDFEPAELLQLAGQSGDTGICSIEDGIATWHSWSDRFGFFCDSVSMFPENGRLEPRGDVLYEYQTSESPVSYEEAWLQQPDDHGLVAHLSLRAPERGDSVTAVLLVTGRYAGYVERGTSDNALSLEAQLERAKGDPAQMRRMLACEASYAIRSAADAPFVIRNSNLPFREGEILQVPTLDPNALDRTPQLAAHRPNAYWQVESWFVA